MGFPSVRLLLLLLTTCLLHTCHSHLCLISPQQRGDMDITISGSHTCTRHGGPCGGMPAATPSGEPLIAGQQMFMKWQQNFNHYEVGYPGFMDVSIAPVGSDNFTLLAFVPDKYVFAQDHQQNYTAVITVPDVPCEHCVVRARYQSHKHGEMVFYQCSDVKVIKRNSFLDSPRVSVPFDPNFRTLRKATELQMNYPMKESIDTSFYLQGLAYNEFEPGRFHFVNVSLDLGFVQPLTEFNIGVDLTHIPRKFALQQPNFLMDGITALNPAESEMLTIYHHGGSMDDAASEVMVLFTNSGKMELTTPLVGFDGVPISALEFVQPRTYVSFSIKEDPEKSGTFYFNLGQINYVPGTGLVYKKIYSSPDTEDLYVNFQWASMDRTSGQLFVLMGNENEPDTLDARIYVYNFFNRSLVKMVPVQKSICTFMSIHVYRPTAQSPALLYAVAPEGLYAEKRPAWSLIQIDPMSGFVTPLFQISPAGLFERYYDNSVLFRRDTNIICLFV
ncbi:uncharacterized protein LOC110467303 isoform X2 [Mizuhopecten yessoensis]|uniref:uncharacterized protein LOC110467303 isoform X2 n=1 Tax=Mizuhopecten yessoensis TaxID=6573 RepID=UPI000B45B19C|nr:uncharacterized protein LOC110467303 isoform X2 [Mizuhopecten yessoensis]